MTVHCNLKKRERDYYQIANIKFRSSTNKKYINTLKQLFYFCKKNDLKMRRNFDLKGISGALMLILTIGLLTNGKVQAQSRSFFMPYSSVGFGVGTSSYYGDLAPYRTPLASTFKMMRWSVGANYTRHFTPRLGARASFTWARIAGDDYE
jgi:hypothetical protein